MYIYRIVPIYTYAYAYAYAYIYIYIYICIYIYIYVHTYVNIYTSLGPPHADALALDVVCLAVVSLLVQPPGVISLLSSLLVSSLLALSLLSLLSSLLLVVVVVGCYTIKKYLYSLVAICIDVRFFTLLS